MDNAVAPAIAAINAAAEHATRIAAERAFRYPSNQGTPDAFEHRVSVRLSGASVTLHSDCNAQVSEQRAKEELCAVWDGMVMALAPELCAALRGTKTTRTGFWNMGRFCTGGFARTVRARSERESLKP